MNMAVERRYGNMADNIYSKIKANLGLAEGDNGCFIEGVAVQELMRRKGVCSVLMSEVIDMATSKKKMKLFIQYQGQI